MRSVPSITIVYDHPRWEEKAIISALDAVGARVRLLHLHSSTIEVAPGEGGVAIQRSVSFSDALASTIALEARGYLVVNSSDSIAVCGNKLWTLSRLVAAGVPAPRTLVSFSLAQALRDAHELGWPLVTKPLLGSWGRLVARASDPDALRSILEHREQMPGLFSKVHLIQEYVDKPGRDIRVFTLGEEPVVAIYRVSSHWITNTSRGGRAEPAPIDPELEDLASRAAKALGGGFLGLDVFEDPERGYLVNEANAVPEFRNTVRVTGYPLHLRVAEYLVALAKR